MLCFYPRVCSPHPSGKGACGKLNKVFFVFVLDGSESIEENELMQLAEMRRTLGAWSEQRNTALLKKMDVNSDGLISLSEFATHFERELPVDMKDFDAVINQFMQVAKSPCNQAGCYRD